jgi:hypothetical protein
VIFVKERASFDSSEGFAGLHVAAACGLRATQVADDIPALIVFREGQCLLRAPNELRVFSNGKPLGASANRD